MSDTFSQPGSLCVPATEQTGPDNFKMVAARLHLVVKPQEEGSWDISPEKPNLKATETHTVATDYNQIDVGFEGDVNGKPGFQVAVITYMLDIDGDYTWFGNGIDAIKIADKNGNVVEPEGFEYFISVIDKKVIELTIEVIEQVKIEPTNIHFRFKAHKPESAGEDEFKTVVLVSEDPVVAPTRPVGN